MDHLNLSHAKNLLLKVFESIAAFHTDKKTIATIGTFDGVHLGHQKIIDQLIRQTDDEQFESLILTFFPHPRMVLQAESGIQLLNTITERTKLLAKTGLDHLIIHPFDKAFSRLTAEAFVKDILVKQLNIQKIVIGHDHRFGTNRTANIDDLIAFGQKYDFEVEQISAAQIDSIAISSTKIRAALEHGSIQLANNYLGYNYFLSGTVKKGKQIGRTIGFPTANLAIEAPYKLIPKKGVYIIKSVLDDRLVFGIMNIGTNPTVAGANLSIEIYYLNFEDDLYDQKIEVSLLHYMRDEQKFDSLALLKKQLNSDKSEALRYITQHANLQ